MMIIMLLELSLMLLENTYSTVVTYNCHSDNNYAPRVVQIMLLENIYSTGITYDCHSDDNYAPRVVNYAPREHLY
jgi:hypothetical protein